MKRLPWALAVPALLAACASLSRPAPGLFHLQAALMHTQWDFSLPARDEARAQALVDKAAALVRGLDAELAMWQPDSELSRLNASAGTGRALTVSAALDACLRESLRVHAASRGALDPSVGPLTQAWWQARQDGRLLKDAERKRLLGLLGADQVRRVEAWEAGADPLRPAWILARPGLRLDLGAVAKGYAQDRVAALVESEGVHAFLLNAGGQVYARGRKPDGSPWRVGILHPRAPGRVMAVLALEDACLSTSGDYEQVSVIQGRRVHHILDPRTGFSVEHMASASALLHFKPGDADAGLRSDAASTAAFVLGGQAGLDFLRGQGLEGLLVTEDAGGLRALRSGGFKDVAVVLSVE